MQIRKIILICKGFNIFYFCIFFNFEKCIILLNLGTSGLLYKYVSCLVNNIGISNSRDVNLRLWRVSVFDIQLIRADKRESELSLCFFPIVRSRNAKLQRTYISQVYLATTRWNAAIPSFVGWKWISWVHENIYLKVNWRILCKDSFFIKHLSWRNTALFCECLRID